MAQYSNKPQIKTSGNATKLSKWEVKRCSKHKSRLNVLQMLSSPPDTIETFLGLDLDLNSRGAAVLAGDERTFHKKGSRGENSTVQHRRWQWKEKMAPGEMRCAINSHTIVSSS